MLLCFLGMGIPLLALPGMFLLAVMEPSLSWFAPLVLALAGLCSAAYALVRVHRARWALVEDGGTPVLYTRTGVLWIVEHAAPLSRVTYVELDRGPWMSLFGLARLRVRTAAAGRSIHMPWLARHDAEALRLRLLLHARSHLVPA